VPIRNPRGRPLARLALAAAAIGLFLIGYHWGNRYQRSTSTPPAIEGVLIRPARPLPDLALRDGAGQSFTTERFVGHWTLLSFGKPSQALDQPAVMRMIEIRNRLASDSDLQEKLLLILVIQPDDSSPASDFGHLSPVLTLLSGTTDELQRLRTALGIPVQATAPATAQGIPCYLIGPSGRLSALFPDAQTPASIASDLAAIVAHIDTLSPTHERVSQKAPISPFDPLSPFDSLTLYPAPIAGSSSSISIGSPPATGAGQAPLPAGEGLLRHPHD